MATASILGPLVLGMMDVMTSTDGVRRSAEGVSRRTRRLSVALAALVVVAAVPTFFVDGILHGTPVMNGSACGTALTMFALALPVLAVGLPRRIWRERDQ